METKEEHATFSVQLFNDIQEFITKYCFLPSEAAATILTLWVIHSWAIDAAAATPYIYIHSPEKQSGKTRLMETLSVLVRNPMMAQSLTDAVLFRVMEDFAPTLMLDEVDTVFHGTKNESMRGVLNSGYRRSGHVWRVQKGDPRRYKTFGCKILAGIDNGNLPDTIQDRSLSIRMRRKPKNVRVEPFYMSDVQYSDELESILERIEKWVSTHGEALACARPEPIEDISDRKWEIAEPLIAIAARMGLGDEAREAIREVVADTKQNDNENISTELLLDIKEIFEGRARITTAEILERLGNDWSGKMLSEKLRAYGIQPKLLRIGNNVARGYSYSDFEPVFESYL